MATTRQSRYAGDSRDDPGELAEVREDPAVGVRVLSEDLPVVFLLAGRMPQHRHKKVDEEADDQQATDQPQRPAVGLSGVGGRIRTSSWISHVPLLKQSPVLPWEAYPRMTQPRRTSRPTAAINSSVFSSCSSSRAPMTQC